MKTLALVNGDLVAGASGHATISGASKIRQELALYLGELLGTDRFHPDYGSILPSMIGQPIDGETSMLVESEVLRVCRSYIGIQSREVLADQLGGSTTRYDASDIVVGLTSVSVQQNYDTINLTIGLLTASGQQLTISRTVQT